MRQGDAGVAETTTSTEDNAPSSPSPFQQATSNLHATARWIVTALAGVGGVLVAGVPLTGLGKTGGYVSTVVALCGLAVALIAIGIMIPTVARVFTTPYITLAALQIAELPTHRGQSTHQVTAVLDSVLLNREELFGDQAPDLGILYQRLARDNNELRNTRSGEDSAVSASGTTAQARQAEDLAARETQTRDEATVRREIEALRATATRVVDFANYEATRRRFVRLYPKLAIAGVIAAAGVALYAFQVSRPLPQDSITKPTPVIVSLPNKTYLHRMLGNNCVLSRVVAVAESGSFTRPTIVTVPTSDCRAARFEVPAGAVVIPSNSLPASTIPPSPQQRQGSGRPRACFKSWLSGRCDHSRCDHSRCDPKMSACR